MNIFGNTVLITGGATGIGLALAEALVDGDNQVIICGRRREQLLAARRRIPGLAAIRICDVSKPLARQRLVEWATSTYRHLNVLVNNAGIQRAVDFRKGARDLVDLEQEIATNLAAPIHLAALMIPSLRKRKNGAIVNISSGLAFTPLASVPVYCATKAGLHSFSLSLRYQLRDTPIRIFEFAPPIVPTALSGKRRRPTGVDHTMSPADVARGIIEALRNDRLEQALGPAIGLYTQREALFEAING